MLLLRSRKSRTAQRDENGKKLLHWIEGMCVMASGGGGLLASHLVRKYISFYIVIPGRVFDPFLYFCNFFQRLSTCCKDKQLVRP